MSTVRLSVESKFGFSGQYIARITGRAPKVHFAREFVGSKFGKRSECTAYETDETGMFEECDVTKSGKQKSYALVLPWKDDLRKLYTDLDDALIIAKRLGEGESLEEVVVLEPGEPMTKLQPYVYCSICNRDLADGEVCSEHSDTGRRISSSRQVPDLKEDGTPRRKLTYRILTKVETKQQAAAATLDGAVDAIVATLGALPAPMQKKVLAAVRTKLFPAKTEETPEAVAQ
jgi:hypothetical protein